MNEKRVGKTEGPGNGREAKEEREREKMAEVPQLTVFQKVPQLELSLARGSNTRSSLGNVFCRAKTSKSDQVSLDTIWKWLETGGKKNAGEKSYKFFREGYVYDVYTSTSAAGESLVKARCYRSLRKNEEPHYLVFNDYSCLGMKDIPSDATCTNRPQSWHIPRATSISPMPVMGTHYARAATDRSGEWNRDPVKCKLYKARGPGLHK
ncbi:hypothetical protein pdam_00024582 [Pocillopora damicornis]|uniref:Uncharacterized protein n=1 Tax=Pocillopora damicornis TaxID=46731 RepID=A0A3M6UPC6_POCDA|nr:hypothetical protein pdam_00024582 [Pocillopora damicornis]